MKEDNDNEDEYDFIEQDGCPEDSDLNHWSHHTNLKTIDDDLLKLSMNDDLQTISFVFGLEVNFQLLQQNEELQKDEKELKRLERLENLKVLNESRKQKNEIKLINEIEDNFDDCKEKEIPSKTPKKKKISKETKRVMKDEQEGDLEDDDHIKTKSIVKKKKAITETKKNKPLIDIDDFEDDFDDGSDDDMKLKKMSQVKDFEDEFDDLIDQPMNEKVNKMKEDDELKQVTKQTKKKVIIIDDEFDDVIDDDFEKEIKPSMPLSSLSNTIWKCLKCLEQNEGNEIKCHNCQ